MFAEKHYPELLIPEELDSYLAKGWYRMGQTIFTTHFLCFDEHFYSAVWIRLPLRGYQFRKSLRKLMLRNQRAFRTEVRKASLGPAKEKLYQRYRADFTGALAPSLKDSLLDGEDYNIFDTYEVSIYDGNRLIAFSFFDLGRKSAASITGVYDPHYRKYSLGIYTMLMEIAFAQQKDLDYFYPGYIVPGYPRFDYKLRIGEPQEVQYFDLQADNWRPYDQINDEKIPLRRMEERLRMLHQSLMAHQIPSRQQYYPLFEANLFGFWQAPYFDYPFFLWCYPGRPRSFYYLIVFNVRENEYQLLRCSPFDDLQFYFNESFARTFNQEQFFLELIVIEEKLASSPRMEDILNALR